MSLVAGIADRLVFLPVADCEDFYQALGGDFENAICSVLQEFHFSNGHRWGGPVGILYSDRLVVMSDLILKQVPDYGNLIFEEGEPLPVLGRPVSKEDFDRQRQLPDAHYIRVKEGVRVSERIEKPPKPKSKRAKDR